MTVTELVWDDGGRSFDAYLAGDGTLLTELESSDTAPDYAVDGKHATMTSSSDVSIIIDLISPEFELPSL